MILLIHLLVTLSRPNHIHHSPTLPDKEAMENSGLTSSGFLTCSRGSGSSSSPRFSLGYPLSPLSCGDKMGPGSQGPSESLRGRGFWTRPTRASAPLSHHLPKQPPPPARAGWLTREGLGWSPSFVTGQPRTLPEFCFLRYGASLQH